MKTSAFVGFFLYNQAISAFQLHGAPLSLQSKSLYLGVVGHVVNDPDPDVSSHRAHDGADSSSVTTRQAFLAKTLVASSLPCLLGGIPPAFAYDIAGVYAFFDALDHLLTIFCNRSYSMHSLQIVFVQDPRPERPSTPTGQGACPPSARSA
jgi:hypothetical protein